MSKKFYFIGVALIMLLAGCEKKEQTAVPEKCNASDYTQVTIGTQTWMAENYRCSKYDTESEAYKEGKKVLSTSSSYDTTPYFTDGTKISLPSYMTENHRVKLGYLYNWAAAVGVADGEEQTTEFEGQRQGICPNGWHIPTLSEWNILASNTGAATAGKFLKTTSGWKDNGNGTDQYGFASLPAGYSYGASVYNVGFESRYCTATVDRSDKTKAFERVISYNADTFGSDNDYTKNMGLSVRCLKN